MATVTAMGMWLFALPFRGSLPLFLLASVVFVFASLAIGLIISSVTPTPETANITGLMVGVLPSFLLSGFAFPLESVPVALQVLSCAFPARFMVSVSRAVFLKGAGLAEVWPDVAALGAYAVVVLAASTALYARRSRR